MFFSFLEHIGTPHEGPIPHSGRYPWLSGEKWNKKPGDWVKNALDQEKYFRARKQLPLITFAQAGAMTNIHDVIPDEYAETIDEYPAGCFAVKVSGDSMTPVFHDGNIAIIDPSRSPSIGCYVLAKSDLPGIEEATLKQYFEVDFDEVGQPIFELRPLNPDYPSLHSERHKLQIIGFVTELIKKF